MEGPIVQRGPGRKMGAICTLLNVRLIKTSKAPALIRRQPRQVLVLNLIGNAVVCLEMITHSSIPAWRIPWTEKPGGLQSMGWQRVGHD